MGEAEAYIQVVTDGRLKGLLKNDPMCKQMWDYANIQLWLSISLQEKVLGPSL